MSREEARERILEATGELVRERSFAELTVGEIMDRAGLERTIFYRHFENVGALVLSAGRQAVLDLYEAQAAVAGSHHSFDPATIREAMTLAATVFHRDGPLLRAVFEASAAKQLETPDEDALRGRFDGLVAEALRDLEAHGGKRFADVSETARALNRLNENYLLDAFGREPRVSIDTAVETLTQIWVAATSY
ncbi:MAG: TetR/AcrR family transcriptional regulator [Solirubrobacterales bacterium]